MLFSESEGDDNERSSRNRDLRGVLSVLPQPAHHSGVQNHAHSGPARNTDLHRGHPTNRMERIAVSSTARLLPVRGVPLRLDRAWGLREK